MPTGKLIRRTHFPLKDEHLLLRSDKDPVPPAIHVFKGNRTRTEIGREWIASGKALGVPPVKVHGRLVDVNQPNWCAGYAVSAAKILFGIEYPRIDAWEFPAHSNLKVVFRNAQPVSNGFVRRPVAISEISPLLRPGQLIGVFVPGETNNKPDRAYGHMALYLCKLNNLHWVMHSSDNGPRLDTLEMFNHFGMVVVDILEPHGSRSRTNE